MSQLTERCQICLRGAVNDGHSCISMFESSLAEMGITAATARQDMPRMMEAQSRSRLRIAQLEAENARLTAELAAITKMHDACHADEDALATRCGELEAACVLARPFVEACDWIPHDPNADPPPFKTQRKEALKALDAAIKGGKL